MIQASNDQKVSERASFVKRNCTLCKARSRLRPKEEERESVKRGLENMVDFFQQQYNALRKGDGPGGEIGSAIENKRLCMDLLEACDSCDKEIDLVNRGLNRLKK